MLTFAARMPTSPEPEAGRGAAAEPKGRDVHPQLWQACAGSMCAVPPVGAAVYYFPQGHAEQASAAVDLRVVAAVAVAPAEHTALRAPRDSCQKMPMHAHACVCAASKVPRLKN